MNKSLKGSYLNIAEQLSLKEDDVVFIASDVTQIALNARKSGERFDANAFIESFQKVLSNGTLIIPAYTDLLKDGDTFDHAKAKPTTGALSNKVFRRKDFIRSKDPLHSVFAWGKGAEQIAEMDGASSLGKGSIFDWMHEQQAKMLCIDVHFQNSLTFVHYVEELENVSYRKPYQWKIKREFATHSDVKEFTFYAKKPWVLTDLDALQKTSIERKVSTAFDFNDSTILFFELDSMFDHIHGMLERGEKLYKISFVHYLKQLIKRIVKRDK